MRRYNNEHNTTLFKIITYKMLIYLKGGHKIFTRGIDAVCPAGQARKCCAQVERAADSRQILTHALPEREHDHREQIAGCHVARARVYELNYHSRSMASSLISVSSHVRSNSLVIIQFFDYLIGFIIILFRSTI